MKSTTPPVGVEGAYPTCKGIPSPASKIGGAGGVVVPFRRHLVVIVQLFFEVEISMFFDGVFVDFLVHFGSILEPFGDFLEQCWSLFAKTAIFTGYYVLQ